MATKIQAALRAAALVGSLAIVTGCAAVKQEQLDEVRAIVERTATTAQTAAQGAQSTAQQALQAAQAAQACCDANTQRIDRMFQESQTK